MKTLRDKYNIRRIRRAYIYAFTAISLSTSFNSYAQNVPAKEKIDNINMKSPEEILDILLEKFGPDHIKETNSYILDNEKQFIETINKGKEILKKVNNPSLSIHYIKHSKKIAKDKNDNIDIKDANTLKCYLAYKKLVKYDGDITKISLTTKDGRHDENSPILGIKHNSYRRFEEENKNNPEMLDFCNSLYSEDGRFFMLDKNNPKIDSLANKLLEDDLKKNGLSKEQCFSLSEFRNVCFIYDSDDKINNWCCNILIKKDGLDEEYDRYCPLGIAALHEKYHCEQTKPGGLENDFSPLVELGPTLDIIVKSDYIHKIANNIDLDIEVDYPEKLEISTKKEISLGKIANDFRKMMKNYDSYEDLLISPEGKNYIKNLYNTKENIRPDMSMSK